MLVDRKYANVAVIAKTELTEEESSLTASLLPLRSFREQQCMVNSIFVSFVWFINDIPKFAANGFPINSFANNTIIYTSGDSICEVQSNAKGTTEIVWW